MKSLMITGVSSDSGKTTFTMGFLKLLKMKGIEVASFKAGPDYIDPMFHKHITENSCYNLSTYLVDNDALRHLYHKRALQNGVNVIEGVMGYFDGRSYDSIVGSSAELAEVLDVPVLLIVDGSKTALTVAAIVKGLCTFSTPCQIKGVVFNKVNSDKHYQLLKQSVETHTDVKCYGYLPVIKEVTLRSRHLGLVQAIEMDDLDDKVKRIAEQMDQTIEWQAIIEAFESGTKRPVTVDETIEKTVGDIRTTVASKGGLTLGVAMDKSFSFYYEENLKTLEEIGVIIKPFSPMSDSELPMEIDGLYLGGGYPEVFASELEANEPMRKALKAFIDEGHPVYAECGGLMYLCEAIEVLSGNTYQMVGAIKAQARMTERLQHFGFVNATLNHPLGHMAYKAHEFHRSVIEGYEGDCCLSVEKNGQHWTCGYGDKGLIGTYSHNHFYSNLGFLDFLISFWSQRK